MRAPSEETKIKQGRGTGHGANYLPWILAREFNSSGTCANIIDWKHHRTIELLSQGEKLLYYILRWDDAVVDIREQYPLPLDETSEIARLLGYTPVQRGKIHMTTDLLVDYANGKQKAFSVKARKHISERSMQKREIEEDYWKSCGVPFETIYKENLDHVKAENIARVVLFYDEESVRHGNRFDLIKHLIATKQITPDLSRKLDYIRIGEEYGIA